MVVLGLGGADKQGNAIINSSKERSSLIAIDLAIWTILPPNTKIFPKSLTPIHHFSFVQLSTLCFILPKPLHLCNYLYYSYVHESLLNASQTTNELLIIDPVLLILWWNDNLERFFLADKPRSELIPIIVVGIQNFSWNLGEITYCFRLLGCWVTMCK